MYTFCLLIIFLALFFSALNSESVEIKQREAIQWSRLIDWSFPYGSKLSGFFDIFKFRSDDGLANSSTVEKEEKKGSMALDKLNSKIEKELQKATLA